MKLIDGDALMDYWKMIDNLCKGALHPRIEDVVQSIEDAPTIEERKTGGWINHRNDNGHNVADCDKCGEAMQWFDDDIKPHYCPNCGADMRGKNNGKTT